MVSEEAKNLILNKYRQAIQFLPMADSVNNKNFYIGNIMNLVDGIEIMINQNSRRC